MKQRFYVFAQGNTVDELEAEINRMIDQGFEMHGFLHAIDGRFYQCLSKFALGETMSALEAYEQFRDDTIKGKAFIKPYKPPPIPPDRANG